MVWQEGNKNMNKLPLEVVVKSIGRLIEIYEETKIVWNLLSSRLLDLNIQSSKIIQISKKEQERTE